MLLVLILLFVVIFKATAAQQNIVLREPNDQCVIYGNNATFHCNTQSYEAYWEIDGVRYQHRAHYNSTNYVLEKSSDDNYTNITLTVITEAQGDNYQSYVACYYFDSNHRRMKTRSARLFKMSCFDGCTTSDESSPHQLRVTDALFYFNSVNDTLTKILFELPESCSNKQIIYNVVIKDSQLLNEVVASKGPIEYVGNVSVVEELTNTLLINHVYFIQVEAYYEYAENTTLSNKWEIGTYLNLENFCDNSITTAENSFTTTKYKWIAAVGFLGALVVLGISIFILMLIRKIKKRCAGDKSCRTSRVMVPNPIYDGPMYESIHQQFSNIIHSPTSTTSTMNTDTPKTDSPSTPHYVEHPTHSNTSVAKNYENLAVTQNSPVTSAALESAPLTVATPPTYARPKTTRERNKLQLVLHLTEGANENARNASRTRATSMMTADNPHRLERGRCDTEPLRRGYNVAPHEDNYITLSPLSAESRVQTGQGNG